MQRKRVPGSDRLIIKKWLTLPGIQLIEIDAAKVGKFSGLGGI
jgi:hypothetical protein